jgi:hypothetical protein
MKIQESDKRKVSVIFTPPYPKAEIELEIYQLDIRKIMKALKLMHNKTLYSKFKKFIVECDKSGGLKTDFNKKIPRTRFDEDDEKYGF